MSEENKPVNQIASSGRDSKQVAGNNKETNGNIFIGIFLVVVLSFGALAWAVTVGLNQGGQTPQTEKKGTK